MTRSISSAPSASTSEVSANVAATSVPPLGKLTTVATFTPVPTSSLAA
jgi:hypothetical protein